MQKPTTNSFHLAGVIPVAGKSLDFKFPWHDSLMPIAEDYLAVERCILECAYAGCETIWIVCNDDMQPLIRHRIGDYVQDPVWSHRTFDHNLGDSKKPIPVYYVPVHPKDRNKRDCLGWSVLYGAYTSWKIARGMSKWLQPDRYYVSFPYGVYQVSFLREHRGTISSNKKFVLSWDGQTIKDGAYLGFTFTFEESKELSKLIWNKTRSYNTNKSSDFTLEEIFEDLDIGDSKIVQPKYFWPIGSWQDYCENIGEISQKIRKPSEKLLKYHEWGGIGNE